MDANTEDSVIGLRFGILEIIELAGKDRKYHKLVKCQCLCGTTKTVRLDHLRARRTRSCGCLQKARSAKKTYEWRGYHERPDGDKGIDEFWSPNR